MNDGMLAVVIGGVLDERVSSEDRFERFNFLSSKWRKGLLGKIGDWAFTQMKGYVEEAKEPLPEFQLLSLALNLSEEENAELRFLIQTLKQAKCVSFSQFKHALSVLEKEYLERRFVEVISHTLTVYEKGVKVKGRRVKGFEVAKTYLSKQLDELAVKGESSEFVSLRDTQEVLTESAVQDKSTVKFGMRAIDDLIGGGQLGELSLVCAFAGEGKSMFIVNAVWNMVTKQGKNVAVFNGEMKSLQYKRRLITRHCHDPKFNIPGGLLYDDIKLGRLNEVQQKKLKQVSDDFYHNESYGQIFLHDIGPNETVSRMGNLVESIKGTKIDVVVIDYLSLVPPERSTGKRREELSETIRAAKRMAASLYSGSGVYLLAAYQTNRNGRMRAEEQGYYDLRALEESGEAEKASDTIIWLLRTQELEESNEVKVGVMKSRDSGKHEGVYMIGDYTTSLIADVED